MQAQLFTYRTDYDLICYLGKWNTAIELKVKRLKKKKRRQVKQALFYSSEDCWTAEGQQHSGELGFSMQWNSTKLGLSEQWTTIKLGLPEHRTTTQWGLCELSFSQSRSWTSYVWGGEPSLHPAHLGSRLSPHKTLNLSLQQHER